MKDMYIAKLMYHRWEEEPISKIAKGFKGTFAIFFYGCNMHCVFCQNSKISRVKVSDIENLHPIKLSPKELAIKMIEAEKDGAASISFITAVWFRKLVIETIKIAKDMGLKIPIVYNSNGYEMADHIEELDGLIDVYLPDFKYYDSEIGKKYSKISDYPKIAKECIDEMYRQLGPAMFSDKVDKGLIVRHLILPNHTEDSKNVLSYLYDRYKNKIYYSIMSQYTPMLKNAEMKDYKELQRKLTHREYEKVVNHAINIGITNAFIQEGEVAKESFIPEF